MSTEVRFVFYIFYDFSLLNVLVFFILQFSPRMYNNKKKVYSFNK